MNQKYIHNVIYNICKNIYSISNLWNSSVADDVLLQLHIMRTSYFVKALGVKKFAKAYLYCINYEDFLILYCKLLQD